MKMTTTLTAAMLFGALSVSGGLLVAGDLPEQYRFPLPPGMQMATEPLTSRNLPGVREQRQGENKTDGRLGKNMAAAPTFCRDRRRWRRTNHCRGNDGHAAGTATKPGMGRGGHHGGGCGMKQGMNQGYQAMDAETKQLYDAFFV